MTMTTTYGMSTTTIPASRSGMSFDLTIGAPFDRPSMLRPMVKAVLSAMDSGTFVEGWRCSIPLTDDGDEFRDYIFDGVELVRTMAYIPASAETIGYEMMMATRAGSATDEDDASDWWNDTHPADADRFPCGKQVDPPSKPTDVARADINRRDYARRTLAKSAGFANHKDWKSAGYPRTFDGIKPHKIATLIELAGIPKTSGGIAVLSTSIVRPHLTNTGKHSAIGSHNN